MARLLFANMTGTDNPAQHRRNLLEATPRAFMNESLVLGSDDETDTITAVDEEGFDGFRHYLRSIPPQLPRVVGSFPVPPYASIRAPSIPPPPPAARSYARNAHLNEAGRTAANALEIADSDDEDDGIEVIRINNRLRTTRPRLPP